MLLINALVIVAGALSSKLKAESVAKILTPLLAPRGHVVIAEAAAFAVMWLPWNVSFSMILNFWSALISAFVPGGNRIFVFRSAINIEWNEAIIWPLFPKSAHLMTSELNLQWYLQVEDFFELRFVRGLGLKRWDFYLNEFSERICPLNTRISCAKCISAAEEEDVCIYDVAFAMLGGEGSAA